jgi:hypothetical protein
MIQEMRDKMNSEKCVKASTAPGDHPVRIKRD